jgi:hypothetical protein
VSGTSLLCRPNFGKISRRAGTRIAQAAHESFGPTPGALVRPIVSPMQLPSTALSVFSTGSSGASDHQAFKLQHGFSFGDVLNKGNFSRQAIKCRDV